ncbi:hypothetical protein KP509_01G026200 [Ceratopteris richardii]|uniref:Uncharacterized protein n=1 Tax=Ceratopteris richardii TaxID=49495 RepID=A0A8T2VBK0_CERRI|nr:hypothetical protein KP509_01G026200 [Ceratopteris richardii]
MEFGVDKYMATMFFGGDGELAALENFGLLISVVRIPVGEKYTYLGVEVDSNFSIETIIKSREEKGRKSLFDRQHVLCNRSFPAWMRLAVLKGLVFPMITYGAELMGAHGQNLFGKLERLVATGMRMICGKGARSTTVAGAVMHREFHIPLLAAYFGGMRGRLFGKYLDSPTWLRDMLQKPMGSSFQKWTWISRTKWWKERYVPEATLSLCKSRNLLQEKRCEFTFYGSKHTTL